MDKQISRNIPYPIFKWKYADNEDRDHSREIWNLKLEKNRIELITQKACNQQIIINWIETNN